MGLMDMRGRGGVELPDTAQGTAYTYMPFTYMYV